MTDTSSFRLQNRNPDILSCIANLSNDEVFTPPELANKMLDTLTDTWAKDHGGESIWANKSIKFLDPCTKSGVFLREITARLIDGLADEFPDLQKRVNHILSHQVFGIGTTLLTSLLARRSLYCSKYANGEHSIVTTFENESGNVWFERRNHEWKDGKCKYCGAGKNVFDRPSSLENYAYAFIHTDDPGKTINEIYGADMQFDVVIGNPPYQINAEGNTRSMPIYHKFVDAGVKLDPKYLLMITPSRWFAGGLGLDEFREKMLSDKRIKELVDYPDASEVFPGVSIEGGVSYFLWDRSSNTKTTTKTIRGGQVSAISKRQLNEFDVLVRDIRALPILRKVLANGKNRSFSDIVSSQKPFGLLSNFSSYTSEQITSSDYRFYGVNKGKRISAWVDKSLIAMNNELAKTPKVLLPEARGKSAEGEADQVLGIPWHVPGNSVCTQTFMFVAVKNYDEGESLESYIATKFFRFLVSLRKISQHTKADTYLWVPIQAWDRKWSDTQLYKKYDLSPDEINYIESAIRPMEIPKSAKNE
jgi:site-specific DNA-methyltransferase (adenine-specific)